MEWKTVLLSRTVWGGAIMVVAFIASSFGFTLGMEDQNTLVDMILKNLTGLVELGGFILMLYGRIKAKTSVYMFKKPVE